MKDKIIERDFRLYITSHANLFHGQVDKVVAACFEWMEINAKQNILTHEDEIADIIYKEWFDTDSSTLKNIAENIGSISKKAAKAIITKLNK